MTIEKEVVFLFSGEGSYLEFVEVEDMHGRGVRIGEWGTKDEYQTLRVTVLVEEEAAK